MHGESIYGTSAGPFSSLEWGKCTLKTTDGKTSLYLHVFDWPENGKLTVPGLKNSIEKAMLLDGGVQYSHLNGPDLECSRLQMSMDRNM